MDKIVAIVERVAYTHTNNWRILATDQGTVKGVVGWGIKEKDRIEASGAWGVNPRDGKREFDAKSILPALPDDPRALLQYAAAKTAGIGEAKEELIWGRYGAEWQQHPDLDGIPGIREATRFAWRTTLQELDQFHEQAKAMSYLIACGCSINMASAAWEAWGADTLGKVLANPYDMAELPHYGFLAVDKHRAGFGVADADPRRMREAVIYAIKQDGENGHTASEIGATSTAVMVLVPFKNETFSTAVNELVESGRVVSIIDGEATYLILKPHWDYEQAIHERYAR